MTCSRPWLASCRSLQWQPQHLPMFSSFGGRKYNRRACFVLVLLSVVAAVVVVVAAAVVVADVACLGLF